MSYVFYNPNPLKRQSSGDCTVRALSLALGYKNDWDKTYVALCIEGMKHCEMPSANEVWGSLLIQNGYVEHSLLTKCKDCYNLIDFCNDHPTGEYVVGTGQHTVYCSMGNYWDSWDSGDVVPTYYFEKVEGDNKNGQ